ncbi:MAG: hypothetical protein JNL63_13010 [Bacteroidia bacterium]|nr:hypothetical protein [Bacteroidia bacterium]
MENKGSVPKNEIKTVRDVLADGLMQGHVFVKTLGDVGNIQLKNHQVKMLNNAIGKKDYYEIKSIILSNMNRDRRKAGR